MEAWLEWRKAGGGYLCEMGGNRWVGGGRGDVVLMI